MRDGIFGPVWLRDHSCIDMLYFSSVAWRVLRCAAIIDVDVSTHRRTYKITHHGCSLVIRRERATSQFESCVVRSVNSPAGLRHRTMTSFMFLLSMTLKGRKRDVSTCLTGLWNRSAPYQGAECKSSHSSGTCADSVSVIQNACRISHENTAYRVSQ